MLVVVVVTEAQDQLRGLGGEESQGFPLIPQSPENQHHPSFELDHYSPRTKCLSRFSLAAGYKDVIKHQRFKQQ